MVKKIFSSFLIGVMCFGLFSTGFAAESQTFTLEYVRKLSRENAGSTQIYKDLVEKYNYELKIKEQSIGEKYTNIDSEGVETEKYLSGSLDFDYEDKIKEFKEQIENNEDINENYAISKYFNILSKQLELEKKDYEKDLMDMDINISKTKLDNGMTLEVELSEQLQKKLVLETDFITLQSDINLLYEELNDSIGLEKTARYKLDSASLITKVNQQDTVIYAPTTSIELAKKESKSIKDAIEDLNEKKKQLENYSKSYPKGTKEYEAKEKTLEIEDTSKDIDKQKDALYFDMETNYLDMINGFARLSILNDDIEFKEYEFKIDEVYFKTGSISKREFLERKINNIQMNQDYISSMLDLYSQILDYERGYGLESQKQ